MDKLIRFIIFLISIVTYSQIEIKISQIEKYNTSSKYIKIDIYNKTNDYYFLPIDTLTLRPFDNNFRWKNFDKTNVVQSSLALTLYLKEKNDKDYLSVIFKPLNIQEQNLNQIEKQFALEIQSKNKQLEEWKKSNQIVEGINIEKNLYLNNNFIILKPKEKLSLNKKINYEFKQEISKSYSLDYLYAIKGNTDYEIFVQLDVPKNIKNFLTKKQRQKNSNYKIFKGHVRSNSISYKTDLDIAD